MKFSGLSQNDVFQLMSSPFLSSFVIYSQSLARLGRVGGGGGKVGSLVFCILIVGI
jgi:hypothetical protein